MGAPLKPGSHGTIGWDRITPTSIRGRAFAIDGGGVKRRLNSTKATREEVAADLAKQAQALMFVDDQWSPMTPIAAIVAGYLAERREQASEEDEWDLDEDDIGKGTIRPQTADRYDAVLRSIIGPRLGALPVGELVRARVDATGTREQVHDDRGYSMALHPRENAEETVTQARKRGWLPAGVADADA